MRLSHAPPSPFGSFRRRAGLVLGGALERGLDLRRHDHAVVGARDGGVDEHGVGSAAGNGHCQLERLRLTRRDGQARPADFLTVDQGGGGAARGQPGKGLERHVLRGGRQERQERQAVRGRRARVGDLCRRVCVLVGRWNGACARVCGAT